MECESLELSASGCPWRQDFLGELSRVKSVVAKCGRPYKCGFPVNGGNELRRGFFNRKKKNQNVRKKEEPC